MRTIFTAVIGSAFLATGASADDAALHERARKLCIFRSAEALPKVPGIIISAARVVSGPTSETEIPAATTAYANDPGRKNRSIIVVELDIAAAGQSATFTFGCSYGPTSAPTVYPVNLTK